MKLFKRVIVSLAVLGIVVGVSSSALASGGSQPGELCVQVTVGSSAPVICVPLY